MLLGEILSEAIHAPFANEIHKIVQSCMASSTDNNDFESSLESQVQHFLQEKLNGMRDLRIEAPLTFNFHEPTYAFVNVTGIGGGVFRTGNSDDEDDTGFGEVHNPTITIIKDEDMINGLRNTDSWGHESQVIRLVKVIVHEFIHAVQYYRAGDSYHTKTHYYAGIDRHKEDGKRHGRRGTYKRSGRQYYGNSVEIEAHAADAATDIIHRIMKEPVEKRVEHLLEFIRSLRGMSGSLSTYRDSFKKSTLSLFGNGPKDSDPTIKRQRAKVWNIFRKKLAQHLMSYVDQISVEH